MFFLVSRRTFKVIFSFQVPSVRLGLLRARNEGLFVYVRHDLGCLDHLVTLSMVWPASSSHRVETSGSPNLHYPQKTPMRLNYLP